MECFYIFNNQPKLMSFENESFSSKDSFHNMPSGENLLVLQCNNVMLLEVSYLVLMLLPTVSRFMSEEVMVMVSYLPKTRAGERSLIDAPAVTFCPQNQSE